jgi:phosphatidylglycerol:prolipoprotein diacylglycerol transferase
VPFPEFDPVIFQIGPFALRWYALAYVAGHRAGLAVRRAADQDARALARRPAPATQPRSTT